MTVEVMGADRLAATLAAAVDALGDLTELHEDLGDIIVTAAGPMTPYRTGLLAASTTAVAGRDETTLTNTARHAVPVHWGANGRPARPFLADAAEATASKQLAAADRHVQRVLDTIKGV